MPNRDQYDEMAAKLLPCRCGPWECCAMHEIERNKVAAALREKGTLIDAVEKLLETDEVVNWPQPHPEILSAAAGSRLTLRMWAGEIRDLKEKVERLKTSAQAATETERQRWVAIVEGEIGTYLKDVEVCNEVRDISAGNSSMRVVVVLSRILDAGQQGGHPS